ncbi:glycoside hydrolase family 3 protein [Streptacidiphilus griseoplanus]|uniref:glycoside hydrolase family 3 protein n=1 Tax=Peterkaempfera griseoplana TaxID=66896 RepID=UPI0006E449F7|nr:glycoside hydrolase family 3 protein [Peterkaempfera griseoplana]
MSSTSVPAELPLDQLPFRDPALGLRERVEDLLGRLTLDERVAMLHQYSPEVQRLGVAAFRTGTEALHGVAWLGPATTFPQAVGLGATWDEELLHAVATATSVEQRAFHHHREPAVGTGTNSLQAWAPVVNLLRDPRWGRNEEGYSEDPLHSARLGDAFCRGMSGDHPVYLRTAPVLKHFLAYNNEEDRCTTSSGLRPRVLHEYDLAAFRTAVASGSATGVMAAYNLVNGRPCHVSPLLETELRRWALPTGHELFVVSDAEAPSNLVDPEHYFDDHAESHAAALKAGIDSFTDHGEDTATTFGRIKEALARGLITEEDVDRAVRRQLSIRFRLGEFDPGLDPYARIGWDAVDSPGHRELARRAATESIVLLSNDGLLPLEGQRTRRVAVIGPLADTLFEDWYSGTMPYRITAAAGLRAALAGQGGEVVCVEGVDRITLRSRTTGALLSVPAFDPAGALTAAVAPEKGEVNGEASRSESGEYGEDACFDLFDWGGGVLTLRSARSGRYVSLKDEDASLAADQVQPGGWEVHETFRLEAAPDGGEVLRNICNGRYAVVDPGTGRVRVTAGTPAQAERWQRSVVRDGVAEAVAAAAGADAAVVVLGNDPHINGRETEDREGITLPPAQEQLLRAVAAARPQTALVLMSSYPYAVDWADRNLPAVVWTSHGGQETGRALASVLLGEAEPAGRLPQTWYRAGDGLPERLDYDIIKAGWTYQYHRAAPLYSFGHGLSYTTFAYSGLRLSSATAAQDGTVEVSVTLTDTGSRAGTEVVQLYTRALDTRYEAPRLRLADFRKVTLGPGESREVSFTLPMERLAHWDVATGAFTVDPGAYEILVGHSAGRIALTAPLTVTGPAPGPRAVVDRRILAVDFDDCTAVTLVDAERTGGDAVAPIGGSASLVFRAAELSGAVSFEAEVSRTEPREALLELWAGDPVTGTALARIAVPATGGRYAWTRVTAPLTGRPAGVHDLHLVLTGAQRLAAFTLRS